MRSTHSLEAHNPVTNRPRYWDIGQYGVIGDCRTAALVAPDGAIDWCCMPHFDSPAVFCRLLDADKGGFFRVGPRGDCETKMTYLPGTNVLETIHTASSGRLRVLDFMPIRQRKPTHTIWSHFTSLLPGTGDDDLDLHDGDESSSGNDVSAAHRIDRLITCTDGEADVEVVMKPTFNFARNPTTIEIQRLGDGDAGAIIADSDRHLVLVVRWLGDGHGTVDLSQRDGVIHLAVRLKTNQQIVAALNYARSEQEAREILGKLCQQDFPRDLEETHTYWRKWAASNRYTGPYQDAVHRSALTLKLCTFEPTGAIVAAPTTSLPEDIGGSRNWDYRYTWLRDSAFTINALGELGYIGEARDYFKFMHALHIRDINNLRIMYGIRGERGDQLEEQSLDHLAGYKDSHPVRVGNGAAKQHQLDVYGELLDAAYTYTQERSLNRGNRFSESGHDLRDLASSVANFVADHWQDKDHGIWEIRGDPRAYVYSRVMCWVALERAAQMHQNHGHDGDIAQWRRLRDTIHQDVMRNGYDTQLGTFTQAYGQHDLDASNLRIPMVRFLPPHDKHVVSTVDVTSKKLASAHSLIYRYEPATIGPDQSRAREDHKVDHLPGCEGAFLACTFWHISDLCILGRTDEARERLETLIDFASPLGLFSEEIDAESTALLGNYPQAFTHIGLVNAAVNLLKAQEGGLRTQRREHTRG